MKIVAVIATMKAKPGQEESLKQALLGLIEPSRADKGCIQYKLHQSQTEPGEFVFYEQWESTDDLNSHLAQPHLEAFKEKTGDLLAGPLDIQMLDIL